MPTFAAFFLAKSMMQAIMSDCVRSDQQFKTKHSVREVLQSERRHSCASLRLLRADAFGDSQQKSARPCRRIKYGDPGVTQPLGRKAIAQCAIKRTVHVSNDFDRREVDAEASARFRIKCLKEILVEIENRIVAALRDCENLGSKAVHGIAHHVETNADVLHDLFKAQHTQSRSHQGMFLRHVLPSVSPNELSRPFANKQQTESKRLSEGRRKELIEISRGVAACFRMGVKNVAEFLSYLEEGMPRIDSIVKLGQPIANDAAD